MVKRGKKYIDRARTFQVVTAEGVDGCVVCALAAVDHNKLTHNREHRESEVDLFAVRLRPDHSSSAPGWGEKRLIMVMKLNEEMSRMQTHETSSNASYIVYKTIHRWPLTIIEQWWGYSEWKMCISNSLAGVNVPVKRLQTLWRLNSNLACSMWMKKFRFPFFLLYFYVSPISILHTISSGQRAKWDCRTERCQPDESVNYLSFLSISMMKLNSINSCWKWCFSCQRRRHSVLKWMCFTLKKESKKKRKKRNWKELWWYHQASGEFVMLSIFINICSVIGFLSPEKRTQ